MVFLFFAGHPGGNRSGKPLSVGEGHVVLALPFQVGSTSSTGYEHESGRGQEGAETLVSRSAMTHFQRPVLCGCSLSFSFLNSLFCY